MTRRAILLLGWLALIVYAYPGYMTWDSVQQLQEARHPPLTDWHPPMMALLWRFTDSIMSGPFPMLVIQTSIMLLGLDGILRRVLAPRRAAIVAVGLLLFPPNLVVMAVIWKDSLMAGILLAGIAALLSPDRRWRVFGCVLLSFATMLRYNAPAATLPIVVLLFQWREGLSRVRRYALAAGVWLAITIVAFGTSKLATGKESHAWHGSLAIYDIGGTLARGPTMSDEAFLAELGDVKPVPTFRIQKKLRWHYAPTWWGPLLLGDTRIFDAPETQAQRDAISATWKHLVTKFPGAYFKHRRAVFFTSLGFTDLPTGAVWTDFHTDLESELLHHRATRSSVQIAIADVLRYFENSFVFRPWFYAILALLTLPLCRRSRPAFALLLSGIFYELTLLVIAPSSDYRYSHWMIVCTAIGILLALISRIRPREPAKSS
ncbi:MAG: hypothetical protein ACKV2T_20215 [Kofleriaceae bacterium]